MRIIFARLGRSCKVGGIECLGGRGLPTSVAASGGRERDATFALNAYPSAAVKIGLNYVRVMEVRGGTFDGTKASALMVRAQLAY